MTGPDDRLLVGGQPTTLRALASEGRLKLGRMSRLEADDWVPGGDIHHAQIDGQGDLLPIDAQTYDELASVSTDSPGMDRSPAPDN